MVRKIIGLLRLMRPANIITAISDILAGIAIAGYITTGDIAAIQMRPVFLLVIATVGLYGGGVVFNDVFDAGLDKTERPERPIPSGLIGKNAASLFASLLLVTGIAAAAAVHTAGLFSVSGILAILTAIAAVIYDKWGKHHPFVGPLNMGLCRGFNLLLGVSIVPASLSHYWLLSAVPVLYIAAITMISRGEVHGGKRSTLYSAVVLYVVVISCIVWVTFLNHTTSYTLAFVLFLGMMIFPPLQKAISNPAGPLIGKAVKAGIIALIVMNAAWAAAFGVIYLALLILLLLPVSLLLARLFAVT
ncbi:MAG: UbiA family prenyltransferase [Sediminibacterium sp.]